MNILFLVMNFLLIFLFLQAAILKDTSFFSSIKKSTCSYLNAKIALQNKWEIYKYQTYLKEKIQPSLKEKKEQTPRITHSFSSHRLKENLSSLAKWNLAPLFNSEPRMTFFLSQLTQKLLSELYSHTQFWQEAEKQIPELAKNLTNAFLDMKGSSPKSLIDLFPQDLRLQKVYYKMLQGSGSYNLLQKKGYPPLEDFFILQPKEKSVTNFFYFFKGLIYCF